MLCSRNYIAWSKLPPRAKWTNCWISITEKLSHVMLIVSKNIRNLITCPSEFMPFVVIERGFMFVIIGFQLSFKRQSILLFEKKRFACWRLLSDLLPAITRRRTDLALIAESLLPNLRQSMNLHQNRPRLMWCHG